MNDTTRPRLGVLLGAESEHEADEFEELAARTLALLAVPIDPPADLRGSILSRIAGTATAATPPAATAEASASPARHRTAAAAAEPSGFLARFRRRRYDGDGTTVLAELDRTPDARHATTEFLSGAATISVVSSARAKASVAIVSGLPQPPVGHTYQLWTIRKGRPRGAGTFRPDDHALAQVRLEGRYRAADVVAITVEPEGGSRQPTTEPLFALQT